MNDIPTPILVVGALFLISLILVPRYILQATIYSFFGFVALLMGLGALGVSNDTISQIGGVIVVLDFVGAGIAVVLKFKKKSKLKRENSEILASSPAAKHLVSFLREDGDLARGVVALRELAVSEGANIAEARQILFLDLIKVVRDVTRDTQIFFEDARLVCSYCRWAEVPDMVEADTWQMEHLIEGATCHDELASLRLLAKCNSTCLPALREAFAAFVEEVRTHHAVSTVARSPAAAVLTEHIYAEHLLQSELIAKLDEEVEAFHESVAEFERVTQHSHYARFGVESNCSDADLRSAYRSKLSQWHPDKLDGMAVELRELASQRVVELNLAYAELTQDRSALTRRGK